MFDGWLDEEREMFRKAQRVVTPDVALKRMYVQALEELSKRK